MFTNNIFANIFVIQKYYPPDFDPSKIPRLRLPRNRQYTVRIMAPCNMRCDTCGDYIARGKKFNARKETVDHEEYLGLKVFRFYFKCPRCMQEITFKTDPKNYDYVVEHGATPNFKALKLAEQQANEERKEKEEEERLNPMKLLENRTKASRREMENLEALEDLKELNQRDVVIDYDDLIKKKKAELEAELKRQEEEDERYVQSIFGKKGQPLESIDEQDEEDDVIIEEIDDLADLYPSLSKDGKIDESMVSKEPICTDLLTNDNILTNDISKAITSNKRKLLKDMIVVKRKPIVAPSTSGKPSVAPKLGGLSTLCSYSGSDSDSS